MALLYRATVVPSKLDLVSVWAPKQPWFEGEADGPFTTVASFRFDDPDGEVGVETLLVRAGDGPVLQIPLTYRNEELPGAEQWFLGTMEHSVLGTRWTYDAMGDPVYRGEPTARVVGSGTESDPDLTNVEVEVVRVPGGRKSSALELTGTWTDHPERTVLATLSLS